MKDSSKNFALLVGALLFAAFLGEIAVRIAAPQQLIVPSHDIWRPDPIVGWRHIENANTQINTGEGMVHFRSDRHGYRINYLDEDASPANPEISILTLGDSFLEAIQVESKETIPQLLQQRLTQDYQKPVEVVNTGLDGWNPNQYLIEARQVLSRRSFDLGIVFLYVANDIVFQRKDSFSPTVVSSHHSFRFPTSLRWSELIDAILYPVNDLLETKSHLFVLLKNGFPTLLARFGLTALYFPPVFERSLLTSTCWQMTTDVCSDIKVTFAEQGKPVLFVLLPAPYQVFEDDFYRHLEMFDISEDSVDVLQPNRMLAQTFAADSLHLVDPLEFLQARAKEGEVLFGSVDSHFTVVGHRAVTDYLYPIVETYLRPQLEE